MIKNFKFTSQSIRGAVVLVLAVLLTLAIRGHVLAATDPGAVDPGAVGLQISPVIIEVNVDPGQTYTFKVSPFNITDHNLVLTPLVNDFKAKDETGTPQIALDGSLPPSTSVQSWITLSDASPFTLAPKANHAVVATLQVPKNAEAGGHYGVVRFTGKGIGQNQSNVSLIASWGTLVLVRVSGQITEHLEQADFYSSRHGVRSGWFEKGPVGFTERLKNTGNVHVKPKGQLTITNMLGKQVGSIAINDTGGNILPASTRRFDQTFTKNHLFGRYTAKYNLAYGTKGETLSGSLSFWVIPYKLLAIIIIVLAVIIWLLVRGIKRYNRKIVNKALRKR